MGAARRLGLTGTKYGCGLEQCGACAVLCDGRAVLSCATPAEAFVGRELRTIANAIFDATGLRLRDLPLTPERLRSAALG